ncbi:MAG: hypothetical protein U9Q66_01625 [Patescibacteria group bacterium]|nr:hypothetical protein [Patescibacteria group bacterium]
MNVKFGCANDKKYLFDCAKSQILETVGSYFSISHHQIKFKSHHFFKHLAINSPLSNFTQAKLSSNLSIFFSF